MLLSGVPVLQPCGVMIFAGFTTLRGWCFCRFCNLADISFRRFGDLARWRLLSGWMRPYEGYFFSPVDTLRSGSTHDTTVGLGVYEAGAGRPMVAPTRCYGLKCFMAARFRRAWAHARQSFRRTCGPCENNSLTFRIFTTIIHYSLSACSLVT